MSSIEELKKRAYSMNTSKATTTEKGEEDFSARVKKLKERAKKSTVTIGTKFNASDVDEWYSAASSVGQRAHGYLAYEGYKKPNTAYLSEIDSYLSKAEDVAHYLSVNKSQFEDYDSTIKAHYEMVNYLRSLKNGIKSSNDFYAGFTDEEDYNFWDTHSTTEKRRAWYEDLQAKIEELGKVYDNYHTIDLWYQDYQERPWAYTEEEAAEKLAIYEKHKAYKQQYGSDKDILEAIDFAKTEMRNYERGNYNENGRFYGSKVDDDNYAVTQRPDFAITSAKRDYKNPTRDDLAQFDVYNDSSTWKWGADGIYRDAYGNALEVDESGNWVNPKAKGYEVGDKLGLFLNATDEDLEEAAGTTVGSEGTWASILKDGMDGSWKYLKEDEKGIYYTYLGESQEKAYQYLSDMKTELNRRQTLDEIGKWDKAYDDANFLEEIAMNAATIPAKFVSNVAGAIENTANTLSGNDINPYSAAQGGMHFSQTVRGNTAEELDESKFKIPVIDFTLGDIYQTGMSRLDSLLATKIFGGGGTVFLGMGAAQEEAYKLYQQGASAEQVTLGSFAAGAAEAVWEYVSFGKLKEIEKVGSPKEWVKSVLVQGFNEASEEALTEVSNIISNALIMGSQSDLAELYKENEESAFRTFVDLLKQTTHSAFGGFLGGAGAGAVQSTAVYADTMAQYRDTGKTIMSADGGVEALQDMALKKAGVSEAGIAQTLTEQAGKVSGETATGKGLFGKLNALGKNRRNAAEVGRLYNTVQTANTSLNQADITKSLKRKGFNQETANKIAEALVAEHNNLELTQEQKTLLVKAKNSKAVQEVISNIVKNDASTMGQRNQEMRNFRDDVRAGMVSKVLGIDKDAAKKIVAAMSDGEVTGQESVPVNEENWADDGKTFQKSTGKAISVKRFSSVNGKNATLVTDDGQEVDLSDVSFSSENEALLMHSILSFDHITVEAANTILHEFRSSQNSTSAAGFISGAAHVFKSGYNYSQPLSKYTSKLSQNQVDMIYHAGVEAAENDYRTKQEKVDAKKKTATEEDSATANKGGVFYEYDGRSIDQRNDGRHKPLTKAQRVAVDFAKRMAKRFGSIIYFYESYEDADGNRVYKAQDGSIKQAEKGFYNPKDGSIHIDLNRDNILYTVSHELVHFIKDWSPVKFKKMADLVMEGFNRQGQTAEDLIANKQAEYAENGIDLTEDEAFEEVIAASLEGIMADGRVMELLQKIEAEDKGLGAKIKKFFQDIGRMIRDTIDSYKDAVPDSAEGRLIRQMEDIYSQLQEAFAESVYDAGSTFQQTEDATGDGGVKYKTVASEGYDTTNLHWAIQNDIISTEDQAVFWEAIADISKRKYKSFARTKNGGYIIEAPNVMMFTDADFKAPTLSKVIVFPYGEYVDTEEARIRIRNEARIYGTTDQSVTAIENLLGPGYISQYLARNFPDYGGKISRGTGEIGSGVDSQSGSRGIRHRGEGGLHSGSEIDSDGNVIPLSQRFNTEQNDIRYSVGRKTDKAVLEMVEKENAKLREDLSQLKELLKLQGKETHGTKFTPSSVEAAARYLKKNAGAKGDTKELTKLLTAFYEHIATDTELTWESVREKAKPIANWLMDHREHTRSDYAQEVLDQIRGSRIYLDESQMAETAYRFESYDAYRKSLMGSITLAKDANMSLDSWWQEMASMYPDVFDASVTAADMPSELADIIDRLRNENSSALEYEHNRRWIEQDLIRDVYDSYWRVNTLRTVADRNAVQVNRLKSLHAQRINKLKTDNRQKVEQLKEQHRAEVQVYRDAYRQSLQNQQKELSSKYQESRKRDVENRHKTVMRRNIRKVIRDLDKILNRGDKKRNVKEDMQGFVSKALELADYLFTDHISNDELIRRGITVRMTPKEAALVKETEDILSQLYDNADSLTDEEFARLDAKRKANEDKLRDLLTAQRNERLNTPVYDLFNDLVTEYASLKNSKQDAVRAAYNVDLERLLRQFMGDTTDGADTDRKAFLQNMRVADMTTAELQKLYDAYKMVLTNVRDANKVFVKSKLESIDKAAEKITLDFSKRNIPDKKLAIIARNIANKIGWDYEKLYYALDRIGSETFTELVMNIANSENIVMLDVMEAAAFRDKMVVKYDFNNWDVNKEIDREFLDNTGKKFKLTLGQLMALYAYSRRDGAWDHIEYGGFVFGKAALTNPKPADSYKLTKAQCEAITNILTKEQKGYAEDMQKYLSEVMGAKGNEVSMLLYGINMFGEKNYFPIHIAGQFKAQAQESQAKAAAGFSSMSNAGFTHAQNPNAKAPFVLESFNEIWTDHVNEMSRYHGTVPALEDMRRVMNRSSYLESGADSMAIKQLMENSYGKKAVEYFDNLYREANSGAITDKLQEKSKRLLSMFRKNSVAYSLSVVIQQPAAMVRAYMMIDRKYFGFKGFGALTSGVVKAVSSKWNPAYVNAYKEMLKYAPGVTMAKEIGGFDTHTGGSIRSYLLDTEKSFKQKWKTGTVAEKGKAVLDLVDDNAIANLPNVADKIAWIEIWNACKRETISKHKDLVPTSDEFMQIVGVRFTEVIRATQVYDSMFSKSPMLKSKNLAVQYLVSFMNEPNTVANMTEKAIRDVTKGDWKSGLKTAVVVIHSIVFTNVLKSIVYAMRDDDEDETYVEKYIEAVAGNMMDDFNPSNYIPLVRDVWSIAQGYDVERADMAVLADAVGALNNVIKNAAVQIENMTEEELIEFDKKVIEANWQLVEAIASCFGIPVKNIRREINGVLNTATNTVSNAGKTTAQSAWDKVYDGVISSIPFMSTPSKQDTLYDAIINGDSVYVDRLKNSYKDEAAYSSAVSKALRENDPRIKEAAQAQISGNPSERVRIAKLIIADGFELNDVVRAINAEINALTPDDSSSSTKKEKGFYTAEDFAREIANGDYASADTAKADIIATEQKNGKTKEGAEESFVSSAKSELGDLYISGSISSHSLTEALRVYFGMDDEEVYWQLDKWDYAKQTGSFDGYRKYNDFYAAVQTGKDIKAVIKDYTDHGVESKTLAGEITSHFKPLYKAMSNTERASIKGYLLNAYALLGYDRNKKSKDIDKWLED